MIDPRFFRAPAPVTLARIAELAGAVLARGDADAVISGTGPLDAARPTDLSFFDNPRYLDALAETEAGAVLVAGRNAERVPADAATLVVADVAGAFRRVLVAFHPDALRPGPSFDPLATGIASGAHVHPDARLEAGVTVEPGAVVGAGAEIGSGSLVSATAVVGARVAVGRDCVIGAGATLSHALLGNRVIIHPGVRIGQDGFGFQPGARGHAKIPQIGRVIIQDDVEIGANATIDRGALRDTVIGEGTKIDNGVHVAHNVEIGRHCVIVAQVGISGSARLGDFVAIGGQAGVNGHVRVGDGAQIAATSAVQNDVPAGGRWGGVPAAPFKEWFREQTMMRKLARAALRRHKGDGGADADGGG